MAGPVLRPSAGLMGLPDGLKEQGQRVDFKPDKFTLLVETKGYRLAWSRMAYCPCVNTNDQTEQSDPLCTLCEGSGWLKFRPHSFAINELVVGELDAIQDAIISDNSVPIRGVISGLTNKNIPYDTAARRVEGMASLTVRPENKLGYYDRIVNLDATIVYSQLLEAGDPSVPLESRYLIREMNLIRDLTKVYVLNTDFTIVAGKIVWDTAASYPASGTQLALHYLTHPAWRIVEHPHAIRLTSVKYKTDSVAGDPTDLPIQAAIRYEFIP